ncbi:hydrogenase formation protein HypD [Nautilia sp. PV-1]|uniref:hydrogenase formation protein HypD n=1 Tax=Nautilia sp. PV-1 TaxID=2579250 RepID=UPI000FDA7934|nr:hydrogenase formation protein HypD [Nautilia sp. PV-1]AZV46424.1 hydrogenase formation protein HypD [Nautilia sp. PV-1]
MSDLTLKDLYFKFRDPTAMKTLAELIRKEAKDLKEPMRVMEICGGHTHTIMKYGIKQLLPDNIEFIHGPGCPVCVMPKERIDHAIELAKQEGVILATLGDMIRVPGSKSSLAKVRAEGADVRPLHSTLDVLKIAKENPDKKVVFFAIGFETTTPMTAALMERAFKEGVKNIYYHINHVLVPPPMRAIMDSGEAKINAFIGPSHVSVIIGAKSYQFLVDRYNTPVVVAGFEPVDVMESILMLVRQKLKGEPKVEIQYKRATTWDGNVLAQKMIDKYMDVRDSFRWRGLGDIPKSALKLREEYAEFDAEKVFADILPNEPIDDHKLCICGQILRGLAKPTDCKVFGSACTPSSPLGSCMVSDEGACNAYYRYAR